MVQAKRRSNFTIDIQSGPHELLEAARRHSEEALLEFAEKCPIHEVLVRGAKIQAIPNVEL